MADKTGCDVKEKSLYLTQIRFLDEQLERFQLKCDELEKQNEALAALYSLLEEDKVDIAEYLKHSAAKKEKEAKLLAEHLESQQQAAGRDEEALKLQYRQELQELQEQINKLSSDTRTQAVKLEEQKEQMEKLMQQQPDTKSLRKQLLSEMEEHNIAVCKMRKESKLETFKVTKGRQWKVKRCLQMKMPEILQEKNDHLEQLEKVECQLTESQEIWNEKQYLQIKGRMISLNMEDKRKRLREVTRVLSNQETEEEELKKKTQQLEIKMKELSITKERTLAEEEALRQCVALASEECHQKSAEVDQLRAKIQEERSRRRQLEDDMQEVAVAFRHILTESEETPKTQQKMQRLLKILESTNPQEIGPTPNNPTEKKGRGQKPQTSSPKPARAETLDMATDPLFLMSRYRPGDLGFVPRPKWKRKPALNARATGTQLLLRGKEDVQL